MPIVLIDDVVTWFDFPEQHVKDGAVVLDILIDKLHTCGLRAHVV